MPRKPHPLTEGERERKFLELLVNKEGCKRRNLVPIQQLKLSICKKTENG